MDQRRKILLRLGKGQYVEIAVFKEQPRPVIYLPNGEVYEKDDPKVA